MAYDSVEYYLSVQYVYYEVSKTLNSKMVGWLEHTEPW